MKMLKNLFASLLFAVLTFTATAQVTHNITFGVGSNTINVTAAVGDILHLNTLGGVLSMLMIAQPNLVNITMPLGSTSFNDTISITDTAYYVYNTIGGDVYGKITIPNTTGVNELNDAAHVKLFPNPATNVAQVSVLNKDNLTVYTDAGQVVITTLLEAGTNTVDISKLSSGMYYVKIGGAISKLIKE